MKKILVFAVDKTDMSDVCYIFREDVAMILKRYKSVDDWAKFIYKNCSTLEIATTMVVDEVAIRCLI